MDSFKNYYTILGVSPTASYREMKSAFRQKAKLYSPDVNKDAFALKAFSELLEAWAVLGDPAKRRQYNDSIGIWERADDDGTRETDVYEQLRKAASGFSMPERPKAPSRAREVVEAAKPEPSVSTPSAPSPAAPQRSGAHVEIEDKDYFDRRQVAPAVLLSLLLLVVWNLWAVGIFRPTQYLMKSGLLGLVFGAAFWLFFWVARFYLAPKGKDPRCWGATLSLILPFLGGALYPLLIRWFLPEDVPNFLTEQFPSLISWRRDLVWGVVFTLIFCVSTEVAEGKGLFHVLFRPFASFRK